MKYIKIGFCIAMGWTWGKAVSGAVADVLLNRIQDSEWYQTASASRTERFEHDSDIKVVKNQIGFR